MEIDLETLEQIIASLKAKKRLRAQQNHSPANSISSSSSNHSSRSPEPSKTAQLSKEAQNLLKIGDFSGDKPLDQEEIQRLEDEARKREEERRREENTVFMNSLPLKANANDIYNFLNENKVGSIYDIRLLKDPYSGQSKGMAYVEFFTPESAQNAVALKKKLMGHLIVIAHSYADKGRSHLNVRGRGARPAQHEPPTKHLNKSILVKNLSGKLAEISAKELENLFRPFGNIDKIDIEFDHSTRKNKGEAVIRFTTCEAAQLAIRKMNGQVHCDEPIIVTQLPAHMVMNSLRNQDDDGWIKKPAPSKPEEKEKGQILEVLNPETAKIKHRIRKIKYHRDRPSKVIGIFNIFPEEGEVDKEEVKEIKKDVRRECEKYGEIKDFFTDSFDYRGIFVEYETKEEATAAYEKLNNRMFDEKPMFCSYFNKEVMDS